jgi:hypothetical protein
MSPSICFSWNPPRVSFFPLPPFSISLMCKADSLCRHFNTCNYEQCIINAGSEEPEGTPNDRFNCRSWHMKDEIRNIVRALAEESRKSRKLGEAWEPQQCDSVRYAQSSLWHPDMLHQSDPLSFLVDIVVDVKLPCSPQSHARPPRRSEENRYVLYGVYTEAVHLCSRRAQQSGTTDQGPTEEHPQCDHRPAVLRGAMHGVHPVQFCAEYVTVHRVG